LSSQPVSITRAKLSLPVEEFRSKLEAQIAEGEEAEKEWIRNWDELEIFKAQTGVWRDFSHELLLCAFDAADPAHGLLKNMESVRTSGDLGEWVSDAKRSLVRGISYLRSIEKRLALIPEGVPNADAIRPPHRWTLDQRRDLIEKIQALKMIMIDHVTGTRREDAEYRALREDIRSEQGLSPLLPQLFRDSIDLGSAWDQLKRFKHYAERRSYIRGEFQRVINFLEEGQEQSAPQKFFAAGTDHDAFVEIRDILRVAKKQIWIVDSWVDETIWALLKNLSPGVDVRILTSNAKGDFALERAKFCKQYGSAVEVRSVRSYHDRFILIDGKRCWHLGASIKDAGAKACLISEISSPSLVAAVVLDIDQTWQKATPLA
jgi:hypothetical protein